MLEALLASLLAEGLVTVSGGADAGVDGAAAEADAASDAGVAAAERYRVVTRGPGALLCE